MAPGLLRKALDYHADHGLARTVGATARYCGERFEERCDTVGRMLDWDRGRGYPLRTRLRAARLGLSAHSYLWLGLDDPDADPDRYLKSVEPIRRLNHRHVVPLHNKYTFQLLTEPELPVLPELYGLIDGGVFRPRAADEDDPLAVLDRVGKLVLKPTRGGKGTGVLFLDRTPDGPTLNGDHVARSTLRERLAGLDEYLVTEFVRQHDYAATIFPDATNTLRIYSVFDRRTDEAEVFRAVHRLGSEASAPTDNWSRGATAPRSTSRPGGCDPCCWSTARHGRRWSAIPRRARPSRGSPFPTGRPSANSSARRRPSTGTPRSSAGTSSSRPTGRSSSRRTPDPRRNFSSWRTGCWTTPGSRHSARSPDRRSSGAGAKRTDGLRY